MTTGYNNDPAVLRELERLRAENAILAGDVQQWKLQSNDWQKREWELGQRIDYLEEEFKAAATTLIGAVSAYEAYVGRMVGEKRHRGRADPLFSTRYGDMTKAVMRARAAYQYITDTEREPTQALSPALCRIVEDAVEPHVTPTKFRLIQEIIRALTGPVLDDVTEWFDVDENTPRDGTMLLMAEPNPEPTEDQEWFIFQARWVDVPHMNPNPNLQVQMEEVTGRFIHCYPAIYRGTSDRSRHWFPKTVTIRPTKWCYQPQPPMLPLVYVEDEE